MKAKAKVRVAVIGLNWGKYHVQILANNPACEVAALCDLKEDFAQQMAKEYDVPQVYCDYQEVLKDDQVDAVVVALPVCLHAPVTVEALQAGKHVLVEKPMAANAADAERMARVAREEDLILTIHRNHRCDPASLFLKEFIAQGNMGDVHFARCVWTRPYGVLSGPDRNWFNEKDKGGGVLFDLGTHMFDKVLALLHFPEPVEFAASSYTVLGKEQERRTGYKFDADDLTVGMVRFDTGLTIQFEVSFGSHIEKELIYLELYGEKCGVTTRDGLKIFSVIGGQQFICVPGRELPQAPIPTIPDDFVDAIVNSREPTVSPESGVKIVRILENLARSAENGWGRISLS